VTSDSFIRIRLYDAQPSGYSSGVWRAEPPHAMRYIARFSPIAGEEKSSLCSRQDYHRET